MTVPIYKDKGDIQSYGIHRGIKSMSHTMNILERIIEKKPKRENRDC